MDYQRVYNEFIADRKANPPAAGEYTEKHHIQPRSLGGNEEPRNLVDLTCLDHIWAHYYLAKIHGGGQWLPINMMIYGRKRQEKISLTDELAMIASEARQKAAEHKTDKTLYTFYNIEGGEPITCNRNNFPHAGVKAVGHYLYGESKMLAYKWYTKDRYTSEQASIAAKGKPNSGQFAKGQSKRSVPIINMDTGFIFPSTKAACKAHGLKQGCVSAALIGIAYTSGGYNWRYLESTDEQVRNREILVNSRKEKAVEYRKNRKGCELIKNRKPIRCVCTGHVFDSLKEAAASIGHSGASHIIACAKGRRPNAGGYKWEYV